MDLGDIGLLNTFKNAPEVAAARQAFKKQMGAEADAIAASMGCGGHTEKTVLPPSKLVNVRSQIYALGRVWLNVSAVIAVRATECKCCNGNEYVTKYDYEGTMYFSITEKFSDPYDVFNIIPGEINVGGTPYQITARWWQSFAGTGTDTAPC